MFTQAFWRVVGILLLGSALITACGGSDTPAPDADASSPVAPTATAIQEASEATDELTESSKSGGTLQVGLPQDFTTLDPHMSGSAIDRHILHAIYDPLVDLDENLNPIPALAESWETPDPTTYIFNLRQDVKFHDGSDFDAEAVKWNIDRILDPENGTLRTSELEAIEEVSVIDPHTVQFSLKTPFPALLSVLADRALPVSPTAVEEYGEDFARNPVGAGPFQFVEWIKNDHLTVRRFDDYWDTDDDGQQYPYLDEIVFRALSDDTTRLTSLKTGEVHFIDVVPPKDVESIKTDPNLALSEVPGPGYNQLYLNTDRPPFDNKALRQAVAYALDRTAIHEIVYFGTGRVGEALIPPSHAFRDPEYELYGTTANLEMARQKLEEGGMPDGFEFELDIFNIPLDIQLAELIKAQLQEVGIIANVNPLESSALITKVVTERDYQAIRASFSGRIDMDASMYPYFTCGGSANYMNYCNDPVVDELLEQARASTDTSERRALYREAQQIILDDAPIIIMHYEALLRGMRTNVRGFTPIPDGILRFKSVWLETQS